MMRIESVTAHAFGPLAGESLHFAPGMTVIVGNNESAKTSWHAAIYAALCGRTRRKGRLEAKEQLFMDRHKPWDSSAWEVSCQLTLDDGRQIEMRHDLAGNVACSATDLQLARDVSSEIMEDGAPNAAAWLGLDRRSFIATACIQQDQLLGVLAEADGMQKILQRASSTAGVDATAAEALTRLDGFQKSHVGRDDARSVRPMRQATLALEAAKKSLSTARADHTEYLRDVEELDRLRAAAVQAQHDLALHEAAAARKFVDEYAERCERAAVLRARLGESPPPALTQTDAIGNQVARALEAWRTRPEPAKLTGSSAKDIEDRIAELPEAPSGDLIVDANVRAAHDELSRVEAALNAQAVTAPTEPSPEIPGLSQDELLTLAQALEMGVDREDGHENSVFDRVNARIGELEARGRRGRLLMIAGVVLVLVGSVLAVVGSPVLGAVVVVGAGLFVGGLIVRKSGDLVAARAEHSELSIQVAAAKESASRFTRARTEAEVRCGALGVPADPGRLRALAADISRAETFAERTRDFQERTEALTEKRGTARSALRSALMARSVPVDDDPEIAYARYVEGCKERGDLAALAAQRPALEEQLAQRAQAEETASAQASARTAAERQVTDALVVCGLNASTPLQGVVELEAWEKRRQSDLDAIDAARLEWSEFESLLGGRTFIELTDAYQAAAADAAARAVGLSENEVVSLAAGDPASRLGELRQLAGVAGEVAASAEGALGERAKDLASVSEAEEAEEAATEQLRWLRSLDATLAATQRFLASAQVRVQRDLAPVLAANLAEWLPTITGGRYNDAIISIETLEVQVCGSDRRWRSAKRLSQGTAEQVYLLLRAALARHLTAGRETCPLLLDDVTVQSDATRSTAILELLHELSNEQQVIVFAQERGVADWARTHLISPVDAMVELSVVATT